MECGVLSRVSGSLVRRGKYFQPGVAVAFAFSRSSGIV